MSVPDEIRDLDLSVMEVDTRPLGGGAEVVWLFDGKSHCIIVSRPDGDVASYLPTLQGDTAREMFAHPFSFPTVPDIFKDHPAPEGVVITPTEARARGAI